MNFEIHFEQAFEHLTGEQLQKGKNIFVERYNKGGMSGGFVSTDFWIKQGLPYI